MNHQERKLLGQFLRSRRERLQPAQLGLASPQRRRAPGLRREEVAQLAGISLTWYTWIEQGRDIGFSEDVLESLARVLQLLPHERDYLFTLAGKKPKPSSGPLEDTASPALQQILDHQGYFPAYLMGRYWHILAWNRAARNLFGDFGQIAAAERNMVWYTLVRPETRRLVIAWAERAQRLIAEFRADCSPYMTDPWLLDYLEQIKQRSPEFAAWWPQHHVHTRDGGRRAFDHPLVGRLALEQTTFRLSRQPDLKLVIHAPLAEFDSTEKLLALDRQP